MTRFVNTTLIGLVAFFVFLAVLWLFVDPTAPGLATTSGGDSPVAIKSVDAQWDPASQQGTAIDVEVMLHNEGAAAAITQVAYRVMLDDQLMAAASEDPPTAIPAGADAPVRFTVELPPDFAARWLVAYQEHGESSTLRIDGTIVVRTAAADHRLPFDWKSTWKGALLDRLEASPQDCPGPPAPLCLESLDTAFKAGGLQTTVSLRNDQSDPLLVRNGTFRLVFQDVTVARGTIEEGLEISPGSDADIPVRLSFDDEALAQWWAGHVGRCEDSRLSLNIGLEVETVSAGPSVVDWDILAAPFHTGFLCRSA